MISVDISEKAWRFCGESTGRLYGDTHRGKVGDFSEYQRKGLEKELRILGVILPKEDKIITVWFDEAKKMVAEKYQRKEI